MRTIQRLELYGKDLTGISILNKAKFLSVGLLGNVVCMWFEVDTRTNLFVVREFIAFHTGDEMPDDYYYEFLGTINLPDQKIAIHIYEVIGKNAETGDTAKTIQ